MSRYVVERCLQIVNRYTMYVPWEQPFAASQIFENPVLLAFLDRYWGTSDYHITCYHSNNPYPGSEYQQWHRDAGISKLVPHVGLEVCPHFGIKFPLVDTYEENGSFEILPATQYLADPELEDRYDEALTKSDYSTPPQPEKGNAMDSRPTDAPPWDSQPRCSPDRSW